MTSNGGLYQNTLTTSRRADDVYHVTVKVLESTDDKFQVGTVAKLGPYTVIPGRTARVEFSPSSVSLPADTVSQEVIEAEVFDAHDNPVADGTGITWQLDGEGVLEDSSTTSEVVDGKVRTTFTSGTVEGEAKLILLTGAEEAPLDSVSINHEPISLTATIDDAFLSVDQGETANVTVNVGNAADGTPVNWFASLGRIVGPSSITGGTATAQFIPSNELGSGQIIVSVAGKKAILAFTQDGGQSFMAELDQAAIVGDEATDGIVNIEQSDGSTRAYNYHTRTAVRLTGTPGDTVTYSLGTPLRPNAEPTVFFPLQNIQDGLVEAGIGNLTAMVLGDATASTEGLALEKAASLLLAANSALDIDENLFVGLNFTYSPSTSISVGNPMAPSTGPPLAVLLQQGDDDAFSYQLAIVEDAGANHLEVQLTTVDGAFSLRHSSAIDVDRPYRAGFRYVDGELELELEPLDGDLPEAVVSAIATGKLTNADQSVSVGRGFEGLISGLSFGELADANMILALDGGQSSTNITFDASGQASFTVSATGSLNAVGSTIGISFQSSSGVTQAPQPVHFANKVAKWVLNFMVSDAHAMQIPQHGRRGVTVVKKESSGWFSSLAEKLSEVADTVTDVVKTGANIVSIVVGLDDFIVLTRTLVALSFGATEDIDLIETAFAAVGAILSIAAIVSAGSLAPAVAPLKLGLAAFKTTIKALGPSGLKSAFGMAKGLGLVLQRVLESPSLALELVSDTLKRAESRGRELKWSGL